MATDHLHRPATPKNDLESTTSELLRCSIAYDRSASCAIPYQQVCCESDEPIDRSNWSLMARPDACQPIKLVSDRCAIALPISASESIRIRRPSSVVGFVLALLKPGGNDQRNADCERSAQTNNTEFNRHAIHAGVSSLPSFQCHPGLVFYGQMPAKQVDLLATTAS